MLNIVKFLSVNYTVHQCKLQSEFLLSFVQHNLRPFKTLQTILQEFKANSMPLKIIIIILIIITIIIIIIITIIT